jgi:hypothetical protein
MWTIVGETTFGKVGADGLSALENTSLALPRRTHTSMRLIGAITPRFLTTYTLT